MKQEQKRKPENTIRRGKKAKEKALGTNELCA